jgi:hypothetical protein
MENMFINNSKYKEIPGFDGRYYASISGDIISINDRSVKLLKASLRDNGYLSVALTISKVPKTYFVHRLVAETFLPRIEGKDCVNHKNSKRNDNRIENLEWVTHEENMNHVHSWKKDIGDDVFVSYSRKKNKYCVYKLVSSYESLDDALNEKKEIILK